MRSRSAPRPAAAEELRLSHQWSTSDVRHKVAQMVADEVAAADVDLEITIFPSSALFKAREQYRPLTRGQLDMTVLPLSYAGGQQPAFNLTLMPGLVKNHDHAARLNESEFMAAIEEKMAEDDVMALVHGYLAGGFAGKDKCITKPDDVEGLQTRAAGKAFEQMLAEAGALDRVDGLVGDLQRDADRRAGRGQHVPRRRSSPTGSTSRWAATRRPATSRCGSCTSRC